MSRLPPVSDDPQNPHVKEVFDQLRRRWQGAPVLNLYRQLAWAPGLLTPWMEFARAMRFDTSASGALRELMIVRSGQLLSAEYEWKHHWVAAQKEGVSEEKLRALEDWKTSDAFTQEERAVLALADDIALQNGATAATMALMKSCLPLEQVAELVIIASFYSGVSRVINSFDVNIEEGFESMTPRDETQE